MTEFRGSILELNNKKAIVMTEKCDFISIKRTPNMFVGQQLVFNEAKPIKKTNSYIRYAALAASVFVLAVFSVLYMQVFNPEPVFAYIDVDINPSMEITIDNTSKVLSVRALNADAKNLLRDLNLKELPVKEAISEVIDSSKKMGYLSGEKSNKVLISAALDSEMSDTNTDNDKALSSLLADIQNLKVEIGSTSIQPEILKLTPEVRKAAVENNMSMGRYELYKELKDTNSDITIEKAKTERVSDMLDKAKNNESKKKDKENEKDKDKDKDKEQSSGKIDNSNSDKQKDELKDDTGKVKNNENKDSEVFGNKKFEIRDNSGKPDNKDEDKLNKDEIKPGKRINSEKEINPGKQDKTYKSDKSDKPVEPDKPNEFDKPNKPNESYKPDKPDKPSNQDDTDKNKPQKDSKSQSDSDWPKDYSDKKNEESTDGSIPDNKTEVTDEPKNNVTNEESGNNIENSNKSKNDSSNNNNNNGNDNSSNNNNSNSNSNESSNSSGSDNENSGNSKGHNKNKEK